MRPTIRAWSALAVLVVAFGLSWRYGPRALNAIVTPLLVVFAIAAVTVVRTSPPEVTRAPISNGFVDDERTVEIELETERAVSATVRDVLGERVVATDGVETGSLEVDLEDDTPVAATTTLEGTDRFCYEVRFTDRGEATLGPLEVVVTDVFGLFRQRFTVGETGKTLVYPRVHDLRRGTGDALAGVVEREYTDRTEFDHLREYQRGDSLRDVHWKSAAKRPGDDLVVTEYATGEANGAITIAAECEPGSDDTLATALASLAMHVIEEDSRVGVTVPDGSYEPGSSASHQRELLTAFALLEPGSIDDDHRREADVRIRSGSDGTVVATDDRTIQFVDLIGGNRGGDTGDHPVNERVDIGVGTDDGRSEGTS
ncbi:DUF58 domain-containing protein [Natronorubrum daqingense]|uniref:Uncharacterized conserved protein, DUF58 family, contains vWF domain n=1 Tax=Natronorubrum daqingense TaxID=588898 RepID=A0A1N7G875_9EURY|nr:DUF58 domain-containing protein [Natronorubrum daqingense]APX97266.1 hypothetical protein BB347_11915 [Natronorubrum daqingense]SIS08704.1 Uncharacterized conserved protein, DUF58 family, contains vWF domain [Natronorubrum daqingense]